MKLVLITGMSGAGKSVALKTLEDSGFEAIDNLPLNFLPAVASSASGNVAIAIDIRSRDFSPSRVEEMLSVIRKNSAIEASVLFLDCNNEVLRRRYTETRRRHPMMEDRSVADGIAHERALIKHIRGLADITIDTSEIESTELKKLVTAYFTAADRTLSVVLTSFSYKRGVPREADMVFDVRFLKNPHYDPALQALTGQNQSVGAYIETDPDFALFFTRLSELLLPLLPRYVEEGKHYLTIAIGCTGGKHRSVYVAEKLGALVEDLGYNTTIRHRDVERVQ